MRIQIIVDDCMSSGRCVANFPGAFEFDDDELAVLRAGADLTEAEMLRAARNCASQAIQLVDDDGTPIAT